MNLLIFFKFICNLTFIFVYKIEITNYSIFELSLSLKNSYELKDSLQEIRLFSVFKIEQNFPDMTCVINYKKNL
jgi:hypothetical protein